LIIATAIPNELLLHVDKTHTDYILEGLMEGHEKSVLFPILSMIKGKNNVCNLDYAEQHEEHFLWLHDPIVIPRTLVVLARLINPF
jgi:hypothetical protein